MYIVEVKHKPDHYKTYWFEVPKALVGLIQKGDTVLCETSKGWQLGVAQTGMLSGDGIERVAQAMGATLPLRRVIQAVYKIPIGDIKIYPSMKESRPSADKLSKRIKEFYTDGAFHTEVIVSGDRYLQDGYTAYLVAKMFDLDYIPVWDTTYTLGA